MVLSPMRIPILTTARCAIHAMTAMAHTKMTAYAGHPSMTRLRWLNERNHGTMTSTSTSESNDIRLNGQENSDTNKSITIIEPLLGQMVGGWITITQIDIDSTVIYGPFDTMEKAVAWARNLTNASIEPVYVPSFNRG